MGQRNKGCVSGGGGGGAGGKFKFYFKGSQMRGGFIRGKVPKRDM